MKSFAEFWPYYLQAHARPRTRTMHYLATSIGVLLLLIMLITHNYWLAIVLPVASYGIAWTSHAAVEGNKPATFRHPLWSLRGDFLMLWCFVTGRLNAELGAAGVLPDGTVDPARRLF